MIKATMDRLNINTYELENIIKNEGVDYRIVYRNAVKLCAFAIEAQKHGLYTILKVDKLQQNIKDAEAHMVRQIREANKRHEDLIEHLWPEQK